jgi:hypothetical protein
MNSLNIKIKEKFRYLEIVFYYFLKEINILNNQLALQNNTFGYINLRNNKL